MPGRQEPRSGRRCMPDDPLHRSAAPLSAGRPTAPLSGTISVPGDKSISHRALMLGALAVGRTEIRGLLEGEDVLATAAALRLMGADIIREADGHWQVDGVGLRSEEHTSELQSLRHLVCRLLLEKKK